MILRALTRAVARPARFRRSTDARKEPTTLAEADTRVFFQILATLVRDGSSLVPADIPELLETFLCNPQPAEFLSFARTHIEELAGLRCRLPAASAPPLAKPEQLAAICRVLMSVDPFTLQMLRTRLQGGSVAAAAAAEGLTGRQAWNRIAGALAEIAPVMTNSERCRLVAEAVWGRGLDLTLVPELLQLTPQQVGTEVAHLAAALASALEALDKA